MVASKEIVITPGMGEDTVIKFPFEGHERFARERSELIVKLVLLPSKKFKRKGNDLIYTHKLSLLDSLKAVPVHFNSIDGE